MPRPWRSVRPAGEPEPLLLPAPCSQWRAPESVLGPLWGEPSPPARPDPRFRGAFNGPVYAMRRLHDRPRLSLSCRPGWYFDSLHSCERQESGGWARFRPPVRRPLDGSGRTAAIGISTVVAWCDADGWRALAAPLRARPLPRLTGLLHVVPSGMFAPPYSVTANVEREMEEELGLRLDPRRLLLAGAAIDPRNQRPEICTLYVLSHRPAGRLNEEFAPHLLEVPLPGGLHTGQLAGFVSPGAAALVLAARLLHAAAPAWR